MTRPTHTLALLAAVLAALGGLIPILIPGCSRPGGGRLAIKGSDTMVALGQLWAEEFMKVNPDAIVSVTGGGSGTGITALIQGSCDVAQASRRIEQEEMDEARAAGRVPVEHVVAWDGIAVIVHPSCPVNSLTLPQLSDVFQGKITSWKDLGGKDAPIVLLARETSSGTHVFFKERVLQLDGERPDADYVRSAVLSTSSQAVHDEVASNPNAIGYVGIAYVDYKVKALGVAADRDSPYYEPTIEHIRDHSYAIARPLYAYTAGELPETVRKFLDFAQGPQGQAIVKEVGFIPVPDEAPQPAPAGPRAEGPPER